VVTKGARTSALRCLDTTAIFRQHGVGSGNQLGRYGAKEAGREIVARLQVRGADGAGGQLTRARRFGAATSMRPLKPKPAAASQTDWITSTVDFPDPSTPYRGENPARFLNDLVRGRGKGRYIRMGSNSACLADGGKGPQWVGTRQRICPPCYFCPRGDEYRPDWPASLGAEKTLGAIRGIRYGVGMPYSRSPGGCSREIPAGARMHPARAHAWRKHGQTFGRTAILPDATGTLVEGLGSFLCALASRRPARVGPSWLFKARARGIRVFHSRSHQNPEQTRSQTGGGGG